MAEKEIRDKEGDGKVTFLTPRAMEKETDFPEGLAGESMRTSQTRPPRIKMERLLTVRSKHRLAKTLPSLVSLTQVDTACVHGGVEHMDILHFASRKLLVSRHDAVCWVKVGLCFEPLRSPSPPSQKMSV